jgi:ribosome biogenesis GTPase / thiamine phosphate phosphatase
MLLERLGFDPYFKKPFEELAEPALVPARVVRVEAELATLLGADGEMVARVMGGLRRGEQRPVTGDWAAIDVQAGVMKRLLPRKTELGRQAAGARTEKQLVAANVDRVLVVMGLDGDFNLRRLERHLTLVHDAGASPVVLLTKAGLFDDADQQVAEAETVALGAPVHAVDVIAGIAADVPRRYLGAGTTAVLVGSSGAGKSTLINHLVGGDRVRTAPVREHDDRGRHTTTRRELWLVPPDGGAVIDTPGMRELQLWADEHALDATFPDIDALAADCRFRDCGHTREPGCAVRAAVDAGELDAGRFDSFRRLSRELDAHARRRSEHDRRAHGRTGARLVREALRLKGRK